jgi:hypothetical protein
VSSQFNPLVALEGGLNVEAPWPRPTVLTAREFCELEDPHEPVLLGSPERPLLRYGDRLVVGAGTGAGKTTMCMRIIRAIVLKETFLEWKGQLDDARALVLDLEQGRRSIKRSLRQAGLDESDRVDYVAIPDGLSIDRHEQQQEWLYEQLKIGGYSVVMFDPLYKLHDGDANDEQAMVRLMKLIDGWRTEFGFALLLPAHLRKADKSGRTKPTMDDIAGSQAFVRGAEVVLGLELLSGTIPEGSDAAGASRLFFWKDRDGDLPVGSEWILAFRPNPIGFTRNDEASMTTAQLIIKALSACYPDGMTADALAKHLGKSKRTIQRALGEIRASIAEGDEGAPELVEVPGPHQKKVYKLLEVVEDEEIARWSAAAGGSVDA